MGTLLRSLKVGFAGCVAVPGAIALALAAAGTAHAAISQANVNTLTVQYGPPGMVPITGNWTGGAETGIGYYDPETATFYEANDSGQTIATVQFGSPNWIPITGDWYGNGETEVGAYDPATGNFFEANPGGTSVDKTIEFGDSGAGWVPVTGDWDGGRVTEVGVYVPGAAEFFEDTDNGTASYSLGNADWDPVVGSWAGGATTQLGVYDPQNETFYTGYANGDATYHETFGAAGDDPISGDWDGDGAAEIGVYDPSTGTFTLQGDFPAPAPTPTPPPTTTTTTPSTPVQTTPVATKVPTKGKKSQAGPPIRDQVSFTWTWHHRYTRLRSIRLAHRLPAKATLALSCRGKGCPFRRVAVELKHRTKRVSRFDGTRYRSGDRLTLAITAPHHSAERGTERIRDERRPVAVTAHSGSSATKKTKQR